jgi:thioredoxin 1
MRRTLSIFLLALVAAGPLSAHQALTPSFPAFDQWRAAVLSGDSSALARLYTVSPEPEIIDLGRKPISLRDELAFWSGWKAKGLLDLSAQIVQETDPQAGFHVLVIELTFTMKAGVAPQKQYVSLVQAWAKQGDHWVLAVIQRTPAERLPQPLNAKDIYPASADANREIAEALHAAASSSKRILLVFGGNWCFDCHVLDEAFHSPEIAPTLGQSFLVVHVDIGEMNKNLDVAKKYDVPLDQGVPAIAVLDSDGKLLFSQKRGEFEAARSMAPEDILAFLHAWQPASR